MDYYDTKQICYDLLKKHGWLDYSSEDRMAGRDLRYLERFLAKTKALEDLETICSSIASMYGPDCALRADREPPEPPLFPPKDTPASR